MQSSQGNVDFLHKASDPLVSGGVTSNKGKQQQGQQQHGQGKQQDKYQQQQQQHQGKQQKSSTSRRDIQDDEDDEGDDDEGQEGLEQLKTAVMNLYNSSTPEDEIEQALECYADDIVFEDPMISVTGKENVKAQFK
jgi:hypothetical protein